MVKVIPSNWRFIALGQPPHATGDDAAEQNSDLLSDPTLIQLVFEQCRPEPFAARIDYSSTSRINDLFQIEFFRQIPRVVLAAVQQGGWTLRYASNDFRADRGVVLAAVTQNGCALKFASPELQQDPEIRQAAERQIESAAAAASAGSRTV